MSKLVTIRDVAHLAGVSITTVSRVLNDADYPVRPQLRQRVKQAAEQLEYTPSTTITIQRRDTSRDIALVIPNISNPFYLQAVLGVGEALYANDYNLVFCNTTHDPAKERNFLKQLHERKIKGVILSSVAENNAETVQKLQQQGMKFVLLDQKLPDTECPCIHYDNCTGAKMAMEHLLQMGHKKIAFATTSLVRFTRTEVYRGYREALEAAGISADSRLLYECAINKAGHGSDYELNIGRQVAHKFLADGCPATAILCINDMVAIGLIQTLVQNGVKVPEDVSVVGFDDVPLAGACLPPLTTVHYPAQDAGRLAAMMLMDTLQNNESQNMVNMTMTPSLVVRGSAKAPK